MKVSLWMLVSLVFMGLLKVPCSVMAVGSDGESGEESDDERRDPSFKPSARSVARGGGSSPAEAAGRRKGVATVTSEDEAEEDGVEKSEVVSGKGRDADRSVKVSGVRGRRRRRPVASGVKTADDDEETEEALTVEDMEEVNGAEDLEEKIGGIEDEDEDEEEEGPTAGVPAVAGLPAEGEDDIEEDEEEVDESDEERVWEMDDIPGRASRWFKTFIPSFLRFHETEARSREWEYSSWESRMTRYGKLSADGNYAKYYLRGLWRSKSEFFPLALSDAVERWLCNRRDGAMDRMLAMLKTKGARFIRSMRDEGSFSLDTAKHMWESEREAVWRRRWVAEIERDVDDYRKLLWAYILCFYELMGPKDTFPKPRRDDDDDEDGGSGSGGGKPRKRYRSEGGRGSCLKRLAG